MHPENEARYRSVNREGFDKATEVHEATLGKEQQQEERLDGAGVGRRLLEASRSFWSKYIDSNDSTITEARIDQELNLAEGVAYALEDEHRRLVERAKTALDTLATFEKEKLHISRTTSASL